LAAQTDSAGHVEIRSA